LTEDKRKPKMLSEREKSEKDGKNGITHSKINAERSPFHIKNQGRQARVSFAYFSSTLGVWKVESEGLIQEPSSTERKLGELGRHPFKTQ